MYSQHSIKGQGVQVNLLPQGYMSEVGGKEHFVIIADTCGQYNYSHLLRPQPDRCYFQMPNQNANFFLRSSPPPMVYWKRKKVFYSTRKN